MNARKLKTILVPTDFSPISINAVRFAAAFCKKAKASLHLINVVELSPMVYTQQVIAASHANEQKLQIAKAALAEISIALKAEFGINVRKNVYTGPVYDGIIRAAHLGDIDLIILGTQGHNSLSKVIFGSTTTRLLSNTTLPILTLQEEPKKLGFFESIILPISTDLNTLKKVDYIKDFTQLFGEKLFVFAYSDSKENTTINKNAQKIAAQFSKSGITVEIHEEFGNNYAQAVINFAKKVDADLITVFCNKEHSVFKFFETNEQNNIVSDSSIPVLNIPIFDL